MKTPATEIEIAKRLAKKVQSASPDEIMAGVFEMNASRLCSKNVDVIRICILVKKMLSPRYNSAIPGSVGKFPGSDTKTISDTYESLDSKK